MRVHDLAGRPRGTGFLADHHGTLITSHEAVDGLPRLVLYAAGGRRCAVTADSVTPLPSLGLALVHSEGLGVAPLPIAARERVETGTYVRIAAGGWREARVLGVTAVTYTAVDRCHALADALELAVGTAGRDALRLGGGAAGGPVLDRDTGAVLGVLGTALSSGSSDVGFAVPLRPGTGPLAELLAENAATVPAYGADLNLAGLLELTATSVAQDGPPGALLPPPVEPVERAATVAELTAFEQGTATVLGLAGPPGSGRTTELAALAARRHRAGRPTLWLRGTDLRDDDTSVADAVRRALDRASRIVSAARHAPFPAGGLGDTGPERLARLAHGIGRPLLVLLDEPEEMPPALADRLAEWSAGTARWLQAQGARLVVACREEYWEEAGACFPAELLHGREPGDDRLPACVRLADLSAAEAREARLRYGIPETADIRHPLTLHLLAQIRAAFEERGEDPVTAVETSPGVTLGTQAQGAAPAACAAPPDPGAGRGPAPETSGLPAWTRPLAGGGPGGRAEGPGTGAPGAGPEGVLAASAGARSADAGPHTSPHPRTDAPAPAAEPTPADRDSVLSAYLDLMCLRIAVRLAAANGLRGTAVRRLAAKVAGQVHEAARRSLGAGQGGLDREAFAEVFPWGAAPQRLGGGTGWASAVLAEGLLVPAGSGYRFAHEEFADWIQGFHLDLDGALRTLVHDRRDTVPHHRIGPVVQALLLLARQHGPRPLASRLADLVHALDADPGSWWAARLLTGTLARLPDATPYTEVLRLLADRIVAWQQRRTVPRGLGPAFWAELPLPPAARLALLRRLVHADRPPCEPGPRFLDEAARLLTAGPDTVVPLLVRWFDDERPLPATPHATVATAAQALLYTHRHRAPDTLTEALADSPHRRAEQLLTALAEEEPTAVCRAVDRWARDERPTRRAAAVTYGLLAAPHVRDGADRTLLRYAALALLVRSTDRALHGGALALLVRDPSSRDRHLARALRYFAAGDPLLPATALTDALATHPEPVLDAFLERLARAADAAETFRVLADATTPETAARVAALVREAVERRPEIAGHVAAYTERRLEAEPADRAVLPALLTGLLADGPEPLRAALAGVLAGPGTRASRPLRRKLLDRLLAQESDPAVLDAVLRAAAHRTGDDLRVLVHRTGLLLIRTPEGAARFDRALVDLSRHVPGFAAAVTEWLASAPQEWAVVVGPSSRRTIENLAGVTVPA
ncbi:trypsin-like peptidase domain-containing protein [Streptomyces sp. NPDC052012]|uniref:trypsin-like peptidase domain-containing protein n=1 Tax=Streptomyces sp. NPDC052012 TaxID=3155051 RepID=UPI00344FE2FD